MKKKQVSWVHFILSQFESIKSKDIFFWKTYEFNIRYSTKLWIGSNYIEHIINLYYEGNLIYGVYGGNSPCIGDIDQGLARFHLYSTLNQIVANITCPMIHIIRRYIHYKVNRKVENRCIRYVLWLEALTSSEIQLTYA